MHCYELNATIYCLFWTWLLSAILFTSFTLKGRRRGSGRGEGREWEGEVGWGDVKRKLEEW